MGSNTKRGRDNCGNLSPEFMNCGKKYIQNVNEKQETLVEGVWRFMQRGERSFREVVMKRSFFMLMLSLSLTSGVRAQEMSVSLRVQHHLLMKVLAFDRSLVGRGSNELVVGLLYQSKVRFSQLVKEELMSIADTTSDLMSNIVVHWFPIDISQGGDVRARIMKHHVDCLYVAPLRAVDMERIVTICRANKIRTMTGVSDYVEQGLAIGIGVDGEKPQIEVNLVAAKAEGADFTSQLLKVARIIE
jgi:hypothetical protein